MNSSRPSKRALVTALLGIVALSACGSDREPSGHAHMEPAAGSGRVVEASCGQCQFDLPGKGCDLAVRIDGVAYYVDGSGIDDHGDAHAPTGLCNAIRMAVVEGNVENGRFVAVTFALRSDDSK